MREAIGASVVRSLEITKREMEDSTDRYVVSLSVLIAVNVVLVLVLGMAVYGVFQYLLSDTQSVVALVLEHLSHVMFLVLLLFITLWAVLHKKVVTPIRAFNAKLYYIASGDMTHISVDSNTREILDLADAINLMIDRIQQRTSHPSIVDLASYAANLRSLAGKVDSLESFDRDMLMAAASEIDDFLAVITKNTIQFGKSLAENG